MNYEVINKKVACSPMSTEEGKKQLNIEPDFTEDDSYIDGIILSSERFCSGIIGADIFETNVTHIFNNYQGEDYLKIRENPLLLFGKILFTDINGIEIELPVENYKVIESQYYFDINFTEPLGEGKIKLEYKTGFEENNIPRDMYHAIKIYMSTLYDQERSGYGDYKMKANRAVQNLLAQYIRLL